MNTEAPQAPHNFNRSDYHPQNLVISMVNGIARFEHWRQQVPDRSAIDEKIQDIRDRTDRAVEQEREVRSLMIQAAVHPEEYQEHLLEARRAYHTERAHILGERAIGLQTNNSLFSRLRHKFVERKQAHHRSKALKASSGLLKLYAEQ